MKTQLLNEDVQDIPITSERAYRERKKIKKTIQKQNKQRAKDMERRIAKYLAGQRTPMSGAGFMKGDIRVPFKHKHFMIECKLSSQIKNDMPYIALDSRWLLKAEEEANAMGSLFPVVIVHLMRYEEDFCFIPRDAWDRWFLPFVAEVKPFPIHFLRKITRKDLMSFLPYSIININAREYVVCELKEFKSHVERVDDSLDQ